MAGEFKFIFCSRTLFANADFLEPRLQVPGKEVIRAEMREIPYTGRVLSRAEAPWTLPPPSRAVAAAARPSEEGRHTGPGWGRMEAEFMWGLSWTQR